jgi:hypothetical protein
MLISIFGLPIIPSCPAKEVSFIRLRYHSVFLAKRQIVPIVFGVGALSILRTNQTSKPIIGLISSAFAA